MRGIFPFFALLIISTNALAEIIKINEVSAVCKEELADVLLLDDKQIIEFFALATEVEAKQYIIDDCYTEGVAQDGDTNIVDFFINKLGYGLLSINDKPKVFQCQVNTECCIKFPKLCK